MPNTCTLNPTPDRHLISIADKLTRGNFISIWSTPKGMPYCPQQSIAMMSYLWTARFNYITTQEQLNALKDILNQTAMPRERREKIQRVIALVFPPTGIFALNHTNNSNQISNWN